MQCIEKATAETLACSLIQQINTTNSHPQALADIVFQMEAVAALNNTNVPVAVIPVPIPVPVPGGVVPVPVVPVPVVDLVAGWLFCAWIEDENKWLDMYTNPLLQRKIAT
jgi:hypothetical protein